MIITELNIFPVKSLGGISVEEAILTKKGFQYDRRWMLVNEDGVKMTQRHFPQMALISTALKNGNLIFTHRKSKATFALPIQKNYGEDLSTFVWSTTVTVQKVGGAVDDFLSKNLGVKCHLVFFPENYKRWKPTDDGTFERVASLADKSPILIANEASLAELNSRLEESVPMNRFRANIIFAGKNAYEEDDWKKIKIGTTTCEVVELCGRCALTTVNQVTAEKGIEPLRTLSTYRKMEKEVKFGVRFDCQVADGAMPMVRVGDRIFIEK